ncbi:MAG: DUF1361 domain-containing protein [Bacteroidetes bacterium]|nr:MAG: DUF1361 domain-containing protein [Bacteroidota bacterium]
MKFTALFRRLTASPGLLSLLLFTLMSAVLVVVRLRSTDSLRFIFMLWNLFLGWIPWLLAAWMSHKQRPTWALLLTGLVWLLFLPNAPYMLTDLFHLRTRAGIPLWYDLVLIMSCAWTGLALGMDSIWRVQELVSGAIKRNWSRLFTPVVIYLSAYGVYLGRYGRWNSWDLVSQPDSLMRYVIEPLADPDEHVNLWAFSLIFGTFLYLMYLSWAYLPSKKPSGA